MLALVFTLSAPSPVLNWTIKDELIILIPDYIIIFVNILYKKLKRLTLLI